ncbi:protein translocase subunit SecD [Pyruvatibacter sp.]|uniref:protein translocase subunit SecD n=1 Tax=Pyruvatibacter sp. TaxID=1981328 RepID=UPI0032EE1A43
MLYFPRWKYTLIAIACALGFLLSAPNFVPKEDLAGLPDWLPSNQVNLGLDLQGGSHLLLEVDVDTVLNDRLEALVDDVRQTLREARIGYTGLGHAGDRVTVRIREQGDVEQAMTLLRELSVPITANVFAAVPERDLAFEENGGRISIEMTDAARTERLNSALEQSIEIVRRRIDELGTTEPVIQRQGTDRILVQVPGLDDPQRLKALLGRTAQLNFHLVDTSVSVIDAIQTRPPAGSQVLPLVDGSGGSVLIRRRVMVSGESLVDAQPGFDQQTNEPVVSFRFDASGAKRFADVTQANVGRPFAVVLDNEVITAPVIREPILGGSGQISGGFTVTEANDLAILLRAGALPAPLEVLEERTVGPGLGADSVAAGEIAAAIGFAAVILFILAVYGLFGVFANVALIINVAMIFGLLSLLQATLTLPGIAGIVLTIGMAVDANVLIFERIKEEAAAGKTPINAIDVGYSRALGTIVDANITTFIAAAILFQMGSGPVRGFAVTLAIGIITSVFTAFTVTRLFVSIWLKRRRPAEVPL